MLGSNNEVILCCKDCKYHEMLMADADLIASSCKKFNRWCSYDDIKCESKEVVNG